MSRLLSVRWDHTSQGIGLVLVDAILFSISGFVAKEAFWALISGRDETPIRLTLPITTTNRPT